MTDDTPDSSDDFDGDDLDPTDRRCHTCHGDRLVIVGLDIDCDDGVNGPFDGETVRCPNCGGTGLEKDCQYW